MAAIDGRSFGASKSGGLFSVRLKSLRYARPSLHVRHPAGRSPELARATFEGRRGHFVRRARRVALDARMWKHAGIGRYIWELSAALIEGEFDFDLTFLSSPDFKSSLPRIASSERALFFKRTFSGIYGFAEQFEVPARSLGMDLLHVPHFNIPVFFPGKLVTTVHDLIYLRDPQAIRSGLGRSYAAWIFKRIQKRSHAIITVSENTRSDLLERFPGIPHERVTVIPEAVSPRLRRIDDAGILENTRRKFRLQNPFVLFVGSLKPHKNIEGLIEALEAARRDQKLPHDLVIVGRPDPKHPEITECFRKQSFVKYLGEVSDPELAVLYSMADLFVLPSFYEGFGLPALEAMACGAPVIVSDRASLPEVVGDAGKVFDPGRVDALSELLYTVLKDRNLRKDMSNKGMKRAGKFSWKKTAEETVRVYERALGS